MTTSETSRQTVHVLVGLGAGLLRWLTWWQAALAAAAAVLFNVYVLPRISPRVFRAGDLDRPIQSGIVIYPMAVLALILCFPARLDIAAVAWAILAAGDGFATMAGRAFPARPLPWNRRKTVAGLVAFMVCGAIAGVLTAYWIDHGRDLAPPWWIVVAPAVAAIVAGFVETAPIRLNDNISVPAAAALVLWSFSLVEASTWQSALPLMADRTLPAVLLNLAAAIAGWRARAVTAAGAIAGWIIGVAIFVGAGLPGWIVLMASFAAAVAATQLGHARKLRAGIAEERGGRRGPGNAIANTGVAAWLALLSTAVVPVDVALLGMVAALATASSDTIASEVGKAWGRTTWLVTSFARVRPGTTGAVSAEGTIAGALGAALIASVAASAGLVRPAQIVDVAVAATVASLVEGVLGATFEDTGLLDNHALNLVNSLIGAALAVLLAGWRT
jgi:uncharacterized protein (TIGR00297 family)